MTTKLNPYVTFIGKAQTALEFYETVFGGELTMQTLGEMNAAQTEEQKDLLMHGQLIAKNGMTIMASDDPEGINASKNLTIVVSGESETDLLAYWNKLSEGAEVIKPFDTFGILTDRFGIRWMVSVQT